jgi:RHS repeat-associated protein
MNHTSGIFVDRLLLVNAPYTINTTTVTPVKQVYDYGYDNLNRLRAAVSTSNTAKDNLYGENVTYDNMGNITSLGRYDNISGKKQIDTLAYTYSHYQVTRVDDSSLYTGAFGFQDAVKQANEYTYDGNGNELKDLNKGISSITYNLLNLPQTITKSDGSTVTYVYNAAGNKLRKLLTAGGVTTTTEYENGIEYDNSTTNIAFIQTEEGRARKSGSSYAYEYDLKDHLGNTRVTLTPDPADGTQQTAKVLQENDYYAFGYGIQSMQIVSPVTKNEYLYNHKELQEETGLYDYGARFYDPVTGRWGSVDPLAEKGRRFSPYIYGQNSPVIMLDPDGMVDINFIDRTEDNSGRKRTEELINKGLGGKYASIDEVTGKLNLNVSADEIKGLTDEQKGFYNVLNNAANDSRGDVNIDIVAGDSEAMVGSWIKEQIDIQDVEKFGEKREGADEFSVFGHEVREQQAKQLDPKSKGELTGKKDHQKGIEAEGMIKGNSRISETGSVFEDPRGKGGLTGVSIFQYKDNKTGKVTTISIAIKQGNIENIQNQ